MLEKLYKLQNKERDAMVERLVKEISIELTNRCYISELITALTLPDICSKAKYPDEKAAEELYKALF